MAITKWTVVSSKHCEFIDQDVDLKEQRVFPSSDFLRMQGIKHQVRACTCSAAIQCNLIGIPCRFALTPLRDDFL